METTMEHDADHLLRAAGLVADAALNACPIQARKSLAERMNAGELWPEVRVALHQHHSVVTVGVMTNAGDFLAIASTTEHCTGH